MLNFQPTRPQSSAAHESARLDALTRSMIGATSASLGLPQDRFVPSQTEEKSGSFFKNAAKAAADFAKGGWSFLG